MENNAIYDRIEDLMAKAGEIKLAVDEFGEMLEAVHELSSDTNITVTDIYLGTTYGEWITDLKDSGKSSSTYADASRMQSLIKYPQAVSDASVCCYLIMIVKLYKPFRGTTHRQQNLAYETVRRLSRP